jgi:hypothetical protein
LGRIKSKESSSNLSAPLDDASVVSSAPCPNPSCVQTIHPYTFISFPLFVMLRQKVGKLHDWVGRQWGCARGNGGGAGGRRRGRRRTVAWGVRGRVDKAEVCSAAVRRVVGGGGGVGADR